MSEAVEDTSRRKNWVIRLVDAAEAADRAYRKFADSMTGRWLLARRRARKERKRRKEGR